MDPARCLQLQIMFSPVFSSFYKKPRQETVSIDQDSPAICVMFLVYLYLKTLLLAPIYLPHALVSSCRHIAFAHILIYYAFQENRDEQKKLSSKIFFN